MEPLDAFASNVRRLRHERGLTQERLAELSDLHLTDITRIETRNATPVSRLWQRSRTASTWPPQRCWRVSSTNRRASAASRVASAGFHRQLGRTACATRLYRD